MNIKWISSIALTSLLLIGCSSNDESVASGEVEPNESTELVEVDAPAEEAAQEEINNSPLSEEEKGLEDNYWLFLNETQEGYTKFLAFSKEILEDGKEDNHLYSDDEWLAALNGVKEIFGMYYIECMTKSGSGEVPERYVESHQSIMDAFKTLHEGLVEIRDGIDAEDKMKIMSGELTFALGQDKYNSGISKAEGILKQ